MVSRIPSMRSSRLAQSTPMTPASFVDDSDAFLTPVDEKDLAAGILCMGTAGGKGKARANAVVQDVGVAGLGLRVPRPTVSFSPHPKHHPYNPDLRVSTSLKPLHSQQFRQLSPSSPLSARQSSQSSAALQPLQPIPQHLGHAGRPQTPDAASKNGHLFSPLPRSILKKRAEQLIRVAATVEIGTKSNSEEARAGAMGGDTGRRHARRKSLVRLDSLQLARRAAEKDGTLNGGGRSTTNAEGQSGLPTGLCGQATEHGSAAHGTGRANRDGSDDDAVINASEPREGISLEESSIESLLDVIIADHCGQLEESDLFSIEDAYDSLLVKLRAIFQPKLLPGMAGEENVEEDEESRQVVQAFRDRVAGLLLAFRRDVGALVGRTPSEVVCPIDDRSSSPSAPSVHSLRLPTQLPDTPTPPSSSPTSVDSPSKPLRRGYTAAEIRYRRAHAGAGQEALKLLAFIFYRPEIFECFTTADLIDLLQQVVLIPNTLKLHTPNPKKSYALAVYALTHLKVPVACVSPLKQKIVKALTNSVGDIGATFMGGGPGKREGEGGNVRARMEGFAALQQVLTEYPEVFALEHRSLLPVIIKGLCNPVQGVRARATGALGALVKGRSAWAETVTANLKAMTAGQVEGALQEDVDAKHLALLADHGQVQAAIRDSQTLCYVSAQAVSSPTAAAGRVTYWTRLASLMKDAMKLSPHWACSTWASLVTLLGDMYLQADFWKEMNEIVLMPFKDGSSASRLQFCRMAWDHAIHAVIHQNAIVVIVDGAPEIHFAAKDGKNFFRERSIAVVTALSRMLTTAEAMYVKPVLSDVVDVDGLSRKTWTCVTKPSDLAAVRNWIESLDGLVYGSSGAIKRAEQPRSEDQNTTTTSTSEFRANLWAKVFEEMLEPILQQMMSIRGMDEVKIKAWNILEAITREQDDSAWELDRLLHPAFLNGSLAAMDFVPSTRETMLAELAEAQSARHSILPFEMPSWGGLWLSKRFTPSLLKMFETALGGLHGLVDAQAAGDWVKTDDGVPLIPGQLSNIWRNLLVGLAAAQSGPLEDPVVFRDGMAELTRFLGKRLEADVTGYLPPSLTVEDKHLSSVQIGLTCHLLEIAIEVIGATTFGLLRLNAVTPSRRSNRNAGEAIKGFGLDEAGRVTAAGFLLDSLQVARKVDDVDAPLSRRLCYRLIKLGQHKVNFLSDATAALFEMSPMDQITTVGLWFVLAEEWAAAAGESLVGGEMLQMLEHAATMLALPIHSGPSCWTDDSARFLSTWQALVKAAIRAPGQHPSNSFDFLDNLVGKMDSTTEEQFWYKDSDGPSPLKAQLFAIAVQGVLPEDSDEKWISQGQSAPTIFLGAINMLLQVGCEKAEHTSEWDSALQLLDAAILLLERADLSSVPALLVRLMPSLDAWLRVQGLERHSRMLDAAYIRVLAVLEDVMRSGFIPIDSASLRTYSDLMIFHVASSDKHAVLEAFRGCWNRTFGTAAGLEYEEDVKEFLRTFMETDSQFLVVPGLRLISQDSANSQGSVAYDADISRDIQDTQGVEDIPQSSHNVLDDSQPEGDLGDENAAVSTRHSPGAALPLKRKAVVDPTPRPSKRKACAPPPRSVTEATTPCDPFEGDIVPDSQPSQQSMSPNKSQLSIRKAASGTLSAAVGAVGHAVGRIIPGLATWRSPPMDGRKSPLPEEDSPSRALVDASLDDSPSAKRARRAQGGARPRKYLEESLLMGVDSPSTPLKRRMEVPGEVPVRPKRKRFGSTTGASSVVSSPSSSGPKGSTPRNDDQGEQVLEPGPRRGSGRKRMRKSTANNKTTSTSQVGEATEKFTPEPTPDPLALLPENSQPAALTGTPEAATEAQWDEELAAAPEASKAVEESRHPRRAEQDRLLELVAEAASMASEAEDLELLRITDLFDNLDRIRAAAMRSLRKRTCGVEQGAER